MAQDIQATEAELQERLGIIAGMIIEGIPQAEIVHRCLAEHPEWGVGRRQLYNYYGRCWLEMSQEATGIDRMAYYYLSVRQLDTAIGKAIKSDNLKAVNSLINTRMKLMGIVNSEDIEWVKDAAAQGIDTESLQRKLVLLAAGDGYESE